MRRTTTFHRASAAVTLAAAAALLLAACGTEADGPADGTASPTAAPPASGPSSRPGPPSPTAPTTGAGRPSASPSATTRPSPARCADRVELTAADSGRTLCLTPGGQLRLTLDGTRDRPWTPVRATGDVLRAANAGIVVLPGDAVAAFDAVRPGTARLTSSRPPCATTTDPAACEGAGEWTVTVEVRRP
ncbi:hypothetical protein ABZ920_04845 [Streptomyces sp. NPDC046831]|uniref:hypothetical protein n=1 Tax=Streptomyces sp. NPDC046831 TaxID=3154805 RepID=UPI0033E29AC3